MTSDLPPAIGIDGLNLAMPHGTGIATYAYGLAEVVRSLGMRVDGVFGVPVGRDPRIRDVLFYEAMGRGMPPRTSPAWLRPLLDRWAVMKGLRAHPVTDRGVVEQRGFVDRLPRFDRILSSALLFERADRHFRRTFRFVELAVPDPPAIMHWTYPVPIRMRGTRNVYTIHDLVPLKLPFATLDRKRVHHRLIDRLAQDAGHIVTVSESSRNDLISMYGVSPERITNTYQHAPLPETMPGDDGEDVTSVFDLKPDQYFLYFGAIEPKKNIARLVEAYLSTDTRAPLVVVGARSWQREEETRLLDALGKRGGAVARRVVQLDYLPRRLLMKLVSQARAVLFPSLYEGFGLPVLEAMQLGVPVITSTISSLPEVAGDAALMVDPYDVAAIASAIRRIDEDAELRATLAADGRFQADRFTLDAHRRAIHAVYSRVLEASPSR